MAPKDITEEEIYKAAANAILELQNVYFGHSQIGDNYALGIVEAIFKAIHLDPALLTQLQNGYVHTVAMERKVALDVRVRVIAEPIEIKRWQSPGGRPFVTVESSEGTIIAIPLEVAMHLNQALKNYFAQTQQGSPSTSHH